MVGADVKTIFEYTYRYRDHVQRDITDSDVDRVKYTERRQDHLLPELQGFRYKVPLGA